MLKIATISFNAQRVFAEIFGYPVGVGIVRQLSNDYLILLLQACDFKTLYIISHTACSSRITQVINNNPRLAYGVLLASSQCLKRHDRVTVSMTSAGSSSLGYSSCQPRAAARVDLRSQWQLFRPGCLYTLLQSRWGLEVTTTTCITVLVVHTLDALDNIACPFTLCTFTSARFFIACLPCPTGPFDLPLRDTPCCIDWRASIY
jgi:hypothetical protein